MIVDRKDHLQYLSFKELLRRLYMILTEQIIALNNVYFGQKMLFKKMKNIYSML